MLRIFESYRRGETWNKHGSDMPARTAMGSIRQVMLGLRVPEVAIVEAARVAALGYGS
jgi:hypothetical protein